MSEVKMPSSKVLHEYYLKNTLDFVEDQTVKHPFFNCLVKKEETMVEKPPVYFDLYQKMRNQEMSDAEKQVEEYEKRRAYEQFCLRYFQKASSRYNYQHKQTTTSNTRYYRERLNRLDHEFEQLKENNPLLIEVIHQHEIEKDLQSIANHQLIEVPYVKHFEQQILDGLHQGIPVYLVGHLGSGKTQLAMEVARIYQIETTIQKFYEDKMETYARNHPDFCEEDAYVYFKQLYEEGKELYQSYLHTNDPILKNKFEPYFISGSYNLTYEDMFVEKTLVLSSSYQEDSFQEYLDAISKDFEDWLKDHQDLLSTMSKEELLQLKIQIWKTCSQLFVAGNSSFGTIVEKQEKEILKAIQEGKVIIVDEMNTIAMQNLIGLNDILQKHVHETAYVTGFGPVEIQDGFAFLGTGNLSTKKVSYVGTNSLNPAFQSRFLSLEYQYVPQSTDFLEKRDYENDQLYRIIVELLLEESGNLYLADGKKNLDELYRLAIFAKRTQNIFCGIYETQELQENPPVLHESVLSMRQLIRVLDLFQHGEAMDLSSALWFGFLSSVLNSDDRNFLMALAYQTGFFAKEDGWDVPLLSKDQPAITYDQIRVGKNNYHYETMNHYSFLEVCQIIYGPSYYANHYPKNFLKKVNQEEVDQQVSCKEYETYQKQLQDLQKTVDLYHLTQSFQNKSE